MMPAVSNQSKPPSESLPRDLLVALLSGLAPIAPAHPEQLKARILARLARAPGVEEAHDAGVTTVRAAEGEWLPFAEGIEAKMLYDDGRMCTLLARMQSAAFLPPHVHATDEEVFVLEGSLFLGKVRMQAGDYQVACSGSSHGKVHSPEGCLVLLRTTSPRLLATA